MKEPRNDPQNREYLRQNTHHADCSSVEKGMV